MLTQRVLVNEIMNIIISKPMEDLEVYIQEYESDLLALVADKEIYRLISSVTILCVYYGVDKPKLNESIHYIYTKLGLDSVSLDQFINIKYQIKDAKTIGDHKTLEDLYTQMCEMNLEDIMIYKELEALVEMLSNDYENIVENLDTIVKYTERLKRFQQND